MLGGKDTTIVDINKNILQGLFWCRHKKRPLDFSSGLF